MIIDRDLLQIFLKNMKFSELQIISISSQYGSDMQELIFEFVLTKIAQSLEPDDLQEFEFNMKLASQKGDYTAQKFIIDKIKEIIKSKPELGVELAKFLNKVDREFFMALMQGADEQGQLEALTHIKNLLTKAQQRYPKS